MKYPQVAWRIVPGPDGWPVTRPPETREEALSLIETLRETNGYRESHPELWLESYLSDIEIFLRGSR